MIFEENEEVCEESSDSILSTSCDDSTDVEQLTSVSEIESDDDNEYCVRQNSFTRAATCLENLEKSGKCQGI